MKRLILFLILALAPALASAQVYAMRDSVSNGYDFWLYVPSNYSDNRANRAAQRDSVEVSEPLPVVVFLHGRSLSGKDLNIVRKYGTIDALWRGRKIDAVVIAPQVNHGDWWRPERVMNVVEWVSQRYDVDLSRLYVLGMSLGGYGTLDFAATYPDRTAAAVAMCGGSTKRGAALHKLNEVPLWIMHGTADESVAVGESRKVRNAMAEGDSSLPRLRYDEQVGANHSVYARVFYIDEIYEWLMKHSTNDENRPVDRSVQIPYSRYSEARTAYAGLPRGGGQVQIVDTPTKANTKGRYMGPMSDVEAAAESNAVAQESTEETTQNAENVENTQSAESANSAIEEPKAEASTAAPAPAPAPAPTPAPAAKSTASAAKSTASVTQYQYHTVTEGDTLGHIAVKYDTSVKQLCQMNGIDKNAILKLGMQLKVAVLPEFVYHIVESGDSYWSIARKHNTTVDAIYELNNITASTILHPGDKLIVSSSVPSTAASSVGAQTGAKSQKQESAAQYHTIESGDTLGHLAVKYHTTVKRICELNNISDTEVLKLGKKLRVK